MTEQKVKLNETWLLPLQGELQKDYMRSLFAFLSSEKAKGKSIYPPDDKLFSALNTTGVDQVKVVILGQDPYHGSSQAHGLSFSVPLGITVPPSLQNIYKELASDLGCIIPQHGHLLAWAQQGVLLLNSVLTVEAGNAGSHQDKGWEQFTDRVVEIINRERQHVVFLLWGAYAQEKGQNIDRDRHLVLKAPHPSPLSAYRGFFGCHHFSKTNDYLRAQGLSVINWQIV